MTLRNSLQFAYSVAEVLELADESVTLFVGVGDPVSSGRNRAVRSGRSCPLAGQARSRNSYRMWKLPGVGDATSAAIRSSRRVHSVVSET